MDYEKLTLWQVEKIKFAKMAALKDTVILGLLALAVFTVVLFVPNIQYMWILVRLIILSWVFGGLILSVGYAFLTKFYIEEMI